MMDLNSSRCRLRPRLLICGPLSLSVSGLACLVESVSREKELDSITHSAAMPLLASEDKNSGQIASFCQYKYKPDYSRGLSFVHLCDGIFSLT